MNKSPVIKGRTFKKSQLTLIWHEGMPSCPCTVHDYLTDAGLKLGLACALLAGPVDVAWVGAGALSLCVTFDLLSHPLHWPGRVLFSQLMRLRIQVECQAQSGWRRGFQYVKDCWLCGLLHPHWEWVMWLWWRCGGMSSTSLCAFWCWPVCAVLLHCLVPRPHLLRGKKNIGTFLGSVGGVLYLTSDGSK